MKRKPKTEIVRPYEVTVYDDRGFTISKVTVLVRGQIVSALARSNLRILFQEATPKTKTL